jgi:hypothetical protein
MQSVQRRNRGDSVGLSNRQGVSSFLWKRHAMLAVLSAATAGAFMATPPAIADDAAPTSAPSGAAPGDDAAPQRTIQQIVGDYQTSVKDIAAILPPEGFADATKRKDSAAAVIPLLNKRMGIIKELAASKKLSPLEIARLEENARAMLYALEDKPTVDQVNQMRNGDDAKKQVEAKATDIAARWMSLQATDDDGFKGIVDEVDKLARANPSDSQLTVLTLNLATAAPSKEINTRLMGLIKDVMTDPYATQLKPQIPAQPAPQ